MKPEKPNKNNTTKPVQTTKGDTKDFDRVAWSYMKKQLKIPEMDIFKLKEAKIPAKINDMPATLARFFSPETVQNKGLTINDFETLNDHPELIVYEGYYVRGKGGEIVIQKTNAAGTSIIEEKIKKGDITEVGIVIKKTAAQTWLGRIGSFLMMGGFLVVIVVIIGIVMGISLAMKSC
jgi:hypothetical protein